MIRFYYFTFKIVILLFIIASFRLLNADNDFKKWLNLTKKDAIAFGISEKTYLDSIEKIKKVNSKVLHYYNNQPEFKISFKEYFRKNISEKRIQKGKYLIKENYKLLNNVKKKFNVPIEIIVAIWGIETNYGTFTGNFNVLESLSTLAFSSKRKNYFKKEFLNALKILDNGFISKEFLVGSWAGAMGQSQFMPSSYLEYAYDFSKDNKTDIWHSKSDIFASISNYLEKNGWKENEPWSFSLKKNEFIKIKNLKKEKIAYDILLKENILDKKTLNSFKTFSYGQVKIKDKNNSEKYFIVFDNFDIIKKYNNSDFYALVVGELANKLGDR